MKYRIKGKVVHEDLSGGFWGIIGEDGTQYLPVNMPEQLKVKGAKVDLTVQDSDMDSIFMWGQPVKIITFHTVPRL